MRVIIIFISLFVMFSCKKEIKSNPIKQITVQDTVNESEIEEDTIVLSETEIKFLKKLINDDISGQKYDEIQTEKSPFYVGYLNEGDRYSVSFSIVASNDFNNDGVVDYIVNRNSEGMLGGSGNTNQSYIYYIMKDDINALQTHSILGYAPFSYNIIDRATFKANKFEVDITQNYRTYMSEDLDSTSLSFIYTNGNVYETSYLSKCALAILKSKTIFKEVPNIAKRERTIDMHNYTEIIEEVYKNEDTIITANLSGCDNLLLTFETTYIVDDSHLNDKIYQKEIALNLLTFLSKNTQFSENIEVVKESLEEHSFTDEFINISKVYRFRLLIQPNSNDKNLLRYLLQINETRNPNQSENWEITTRKKK
jgi:hypothetical protein